MGRDIDGLLAKFFPTLGRFKKRIKNNNKKMLVTILGYIRSRTYCEVCILSKLPLQLVISG